MRRMPSIEGDVLAAVKELTDNGVTAGVIVTSERVQQLIEDEFP